MLVNFVVVLSILLGCCGLALDIGILELKRMQMQNAADAAAMGALMAAERGANSGNWLSAGRADAGLNGFVNGASGVSVAIANAPATGLYAGNYGAFQATVSQPVTAVFMGKSITVQAQAVALMPPCGYFMATSTGYPTLWAQSASLLAVCPTYESQYYTIDGFASSRYDVNYVGGSSGLSGGGGNVTDPIFNFPAISDPLSHVTSPTFTTPCTYIGLPNIIIPTVLNPGTYCNLPLLPGLTIIATTVSFNPGLYVITGGMSVTGSTLNLNVAGGGVTLYMTKRTDIAVTPAYGQISLTNSTLNLSAPSDASAGGVPGILMFGDRNWIPTTYQDISLQSVSSTGDGIIYFQKAGIYEYNSNFVPPNYYGLVVDNMHEFFGNIHLAPNYSFVQGGNPFRPRESLAE